MKVYFQEVPLPMELVQHCQIKLFSYTFNSVSNFISFFEI
jgi:hypothetical protein